MFGISLVRAVRGGIGESKSASLVPELSLEDFARVEIE